MTFYSFYLDLNPITLIFKLDLDMVEMYPQSEKKVPGFGSLKVTA